MKEGNSFKALNGANQNMGTINALEYMKNGFLAVGGSSQKMNIWDVNKGALNKTFYRSSDATALAFTENGCIARGGFKEITIYDLIKREHDILFVLKDWAKALVYVGNGYLASSEQNANGTIKIWDIDQEKLFKTLEGHKGWAKVLEKIENGLIASGGSDETVKIWNVTEGKLVKTFKTGQIESLAYLDKVFLAIGSNDWTVKILDIDLEKIVLKLVGHTGYVKSVVYLKNGFLASGSDDSKIKIWDLRES